MCIFKLLGLFLLVFLSEAASNVTQVLNSLKSDLRFPADLWNQTDPRKWEGVGWTAEGKVHSLSLVNKGLNGTLASNLWDELDSLVFLDFSNNHIYELNLSGFDNMVLTTLNLSFNDLSQVPDGLSKLYSLQNLDLSGNRLTGKVPDFRVLKQLNISHNKFTGNVSFGNNFGLEVLDLSYNSFGGSIPTDKILQLRNVQALNMSNNQLQSVIPNVFGSLTNLRRLVLSENHLEGSIPDDLENCTQLVALDLTTNNLTGGLPSNLGRLPMLTVLSVGLNNLSGKLEFEAGSFQRLQSLYLTKNRFSGELPSRFGSLKELRLLYLTDNQFTGSIPPELGNCTLLRELWLNGNHLTGLIPSELSKLQNLHQLVLNNNNLTGRIPEVLGNCSELKVLWLESNNFTGELPGSFGSLSNLLMLSVSSNQLEGEIPETYRNLKALIGLDVGFNKMRGPVPGFLKEISSLQFLFLANNSFTGAVPAWLPDLNYLRALDLSGNSLTGSIPPETGRLFKRVHLYNETDQSAVVHVDGLSYKGFALPTTVYLSRNQLSGSIPAEIGNLDKLQVLDLSYNDLTGSIPSTLGSARNLLKLNLSHNQLSGGIPGEFSSLSFLTSLDVSYNNLEGPIPASSQFLTFCPSCFAENKRLCGPPLLNKCNHSDLLPSDASPDRSSRTLRRMIPVLIAICGAVFVCGFVAMCFALSRRRQKLYSNGEGSCEKNNNNNANMSFSVTFCEKLPEQILPEKLAAATNNYSQTNVVGDGGFGVVYRAVLETGTVVAVKKLTSGGLQGDREFHAELQTLGELKHKNLVPLLGYCSDGNERLLIYKYLRNGSLDTWLYCREAGMKPLDWPTRLKIARGAAQGIAYLHEEGDHRSIIHRDIKVSNILLDEEFEAHVADFGLARLVSAGETHVSTDVAGTIGYIPPEYNHKCFANPKGDVYSFGIVCLEILTAKRPTDQFFRKTGAGHLVGWIQSLKNLEEFRAAVDPSLLLDESFSSMDSSSSGGGSSGNSSGGRIQQMVEVMKIACCCCRDAPSKRPSMQEVVDSLEKIEIMWPSGGGGGGGNLKRRSSTDSIVELTTVM